MTLSDGVAVMVAVTVAVAAAVLEELAISHSHNSHNSVLTTAHATLDLDSLLQEELLK
jgi:hypothetical protein